MSEKNSQQHITATVFRDVKGKKTNWPLRIGLYVVLLIFWILALGFFETVKEPIKNGFMQQVSSGTNLQQTARTYSVTIGFIKGAINFVVLGLAIIFWRITEKKH